MWGDLDIVCIVANVHIYIARAKMLILNSKPDV